MPSSLFWGGVPAERRLKGSLNWGGCDREVGGHGRMTGEAQLDCNLQRGWACHQKRKPQCKGDFILFGKAMGTNEYIFILKGDFQVHSGSVRPRTYYRQLMTLYLV